jgi:hypothetical protein
VFRFIVACTALAVLAAGSQMHAQHVHESGYVAELKGVSAFPPNHSPGVGSARLILDFALFTLRVRADFSGLSGSVASARLHGLSPLPLVGFANPVTPAPSLPGFPLGVLAGAYDHTIDLSLASSYDPAFLAENGGTVSLASNALFAGLNEGRVYFCVRTSAYDAGEIQGFLLPTPKPDFNFDGIVDGADFAVWSDAYAIEHFGDATGDGLTDGADFLEWQRQLGAKASLGGGHGHSAAVPEPALWSVATSLAAAGALWRRCQLGGAGGFPRLFPGKLVAWPSGFGHDDGA